MRRLLALAAAASLLLAFTAAPAAATSTRLAFTCEEYLVGLLAAPVEWVDEDGVYHMRGWMARYVDVGSPLCAGVNIATANANIDLATGEGVVWGTGHMTLTAGGGWDGHFVSHLTPGGPNIWEGKVVMHGWGAMAGWQARASLVEPGPATAIISGVAWKPGS